MNKKHTRNRRFLTGIFGFLLVSALSSCASAPDSALSIDLGAGTSLGAVSASASITENHATGEITGDTKKYGYINDAASGSSHAREKIDAAVSPAMEKARAIAVYEIIQQVRSMGGNAVTNVLTNTHRDYDIKAGIETVTVTITADAIKK